MSAMDKAWFVDWAIVICATWGLAAILLVAGAHLLDAWRAGRERRLYRRIRRAEHQPAYRKARS